MSARPVSEQTKSVHFRPGDAFSGVRPAVFVRIEIPCAAGLKLSDGSREK